MDFQSLNRRELQYLCKLNKIPANITNIAMVDALKSLETVAGIEQIMNPSRSETAGSSIESPEKIEVSSPRVLRTSYRTSTRQKVKKSEAESLKVTASSTTRGVRLFQKTPSVSSTRKKALTTSCQNVEGQQNECEQVAKNECLVDHEMKCIQNTPVAVPTTYSWRKGTTTSTRLDTVKKENTVQRVYSTRRSARLTEKKCAESGVINRERSQPVKIDSFLEEVSVTSEDALGNLVLKKNMGLGSGSKEAFHESNMWTTDGNAGEGSVKNCDVGVSKAKMEDICNVFEKLDFLVVDGNDQNSTIEKADGCVEVNNLKGEEKEDGCAEFGNLKGEEKANACVEFDNSKVKSIEIIEQHEDEDSEEKHIVGEKFVLNEVGNSEEISDQVDLLKPDSEVISNPSEDGDLEENFTVLDEKLSPVYFGPEEHLDSLLLSEADGINVDANSFDTKNPSNPSGSGSTNMLGGLIHNNHSVAKELTVEPEGLEENISRNNADVVLVNPNEQEPDMDFETPEEAQESLIKETVVDIMQPTIYQEIQETIIGAEKVTHESAADISFIKGNQSSTNANEVIDHTTHLTPIKNQILSNSPTSIRGITDDNENSGRKLQVDIVEEDKTINKKAGNAKSMSLNETSMRQLKKQLKALSIKSNMITNKDGMATEARPILQVVCDNQLASGDDN